MHLSINQNQRLFHGIWRTRKIIVSFFITYAHFLIYCCLIHWCIHFLFLCPSCYTAHICTFVFMYLCNVGKTPYVFIHGFLLISSVYFTSSVAVIAVMKLVHFMIPKSIFFCCTRMLQHLGIFWERWESLLSTQSSASIRYFSKPNCPQL